MQRLYVVAFPQMAADDAVMVEALRAAHDPSGHAMLRAHFTFVFGCTGVSTEVAEDVVRSVAARTSAIDFHLSHCMLFAQQKDQYVFLLPDQGEIEMRDLHRRLHSGALAGCLDPMQPLTPHLTVCKTQSEQQARDVQDELNRRPVQIEGRLHALSIGLVVDGKFRVLAEVQLEPRQVS